MESIHMSRNARTTSSKAFRVVAALGLMVAVGLATASASSAQPAAQTGSTPIPDPLVPPAGNHEVARFAASGVQIYRCVGGVWTFVEPAASLVGSASGTHRPERAIHFRGPSWESLTDGSLVEAKSIASSPVDGSIPQLLLQATTTQGDGIFGQVTYVQRLSTRGGAAPTSTCTDGATQSVQYTASYRFFAATSS
jgi:hypothetical protein